MLKHRGSGLLLHITSLPSDHGIGDLGPAAYRFIDQLAETGQTCWQILPMTPVDGALGNSPYSSDSAFAGNQLLISPELLVRDGYLDPAALGERPAFRSDTVDYGAVASYKKRLLTAAFEEYRRRSDLPNVEVFARENARWLGYYALFRAVKGYFKNAPWNTWPEALRACQDDAIKEWSWKLSYEILLEKFCQYLFYRQWSALKTYANGRNIKIIGDLPIYVTWDSADVWANQRIFKLAADRGPAFVAGVPPDYFSTTGQLWGNPVYDWDALRETGFAWWVQRIGHAIRTYDLFRLDHFRGFLAFWEVKAGERTAVDGRWVTAPSKEFFRALLHEYPSLPMIAEDLGVITPDVRNMINSLGLPGMKVLLFAFGDGAPSNPFIPHNYTRNFIAYTGTHDNNTVMGWFRNEASLDEKRRLYAYLGREVHGRDVHWEVIRLVMMSVAKLVILPMQDVLGLGEEARMNHPSVAHGNWGWRMLPDQFSGTVRDRLRDMTKTYGRG